jgi:hypothetical protein
VLAAEDDVTRQRCMRIIQAASAGASSPLQDIASAVALTRDLAGMQNLSAVNAVLAALGRAAVKGLDVTSLKAAGFDAAACAAAGGSWTDVKTAGFTAAEAKAAGCDAASAMAAGYDLPSLKTAGYGTAALQAAAAARIAGKPNIIEAAVKGDISLVGDHIAAEPSSIHQRNSEYDTVSQKIV